MESVPEKPVEESNGDIDDDTIMQSQNQGMSLTKSLEEFMEQKNVLLFTDIVNCFFSVSLFLIYVSRTYYMCKFDKDPVWRMPLTDTAPQPFEYPKLDKFGEETNFNYVNNTFAPSNKTIDEHYFPSDQCEGEFHVFYYFYLAVTHAYFLTEFSLRVLIAKEKINFMGETDSVIEIITTAPFFVLWFILGKSNYYFQLFIVMDTMRLLLYDRYIKNIKSELDQKITRICLFVIVSLLMSSLLIQFIENQYNYDLGKTR